jgi:hypothetical protein
MTCYNSELPIGPAGPTGPQGPQGPAGTLPYKVYTALLTQINDDAPAAPTAIVLENTLSGTPTFEYLAPGSYSIRLNGEFIENKTFFIIGCGENSSSNGAFITSQDISSRPDRLSISTGTTVSSATWADGLLYKTPIEIRVYP